MDFFMALLKFALIRIHVLAWPVFALGYPLCASIRSIETGSKYHMRKLVIYWTLFSLISLFEIAFMKIIQWIPFWSSLKLIAILWLVMPRFDGAFHVYQSFIHPYFSSVHLQEIIDNLNMPKEEKALQTQSFLDIAEKYIKENGSEALEKLITSKRDCIERLDSQREQEEKSTAATSEMLKEHNEMLAATAKSTSTEVVLAQYAQSRNVVWVEKVTHEAAEVKEMMAPTEAEDRSEEKGPRKKLEQEWTCGLCSVTTTSEVILNAHLQGKKHKSKCEDLKRIKLIAHAAEQDNMTFTTRNSLFSNGKNPLEFGKNPLES